MRPFLLTIVSLFLFGLSVGHTQILDPVDWSITGQMVSETEAELTFKAKLDKGWYIYSQYLESDDGPIRTSIVYDNLDADNLIDKAIESGKKKEGHDAMFDMNVIKFADSYSVKQLIKVEGGEETINGYVEYMTCDDTRCLPPTDKEFSIKLTPLTRVGEGAKKKTEVGSSQGSDFNIDNSALVEAESSSSPNTSAQPVQWSARIDSDQLIINAKIDEGWKIYASEQPQEEYSIEPVSFLVNDNKLVFDENSNHLKTYDDPIFKERLTIINKEANYSIDLSKLPKEKTRVEIVYMACDHEQCIFPEPPVFNYDPSIPAIYSDGDGGLNSEQSIIQDERLAELYPIPIPSQSELQNSCLVNAKIKNTSGKNYFQIFWLGFIGGLLALLTPCVFPMIPLTVSFFTKQRENQGEKKGINKAFLYALSIVLIYFILSVPFHFLDTLNPDILNNIATNIYLNIFFFVAFIFFAFSFFGYYELTIPSSWTNRVSKAEGSGGFIGIFFMALTLCLVSFSCTGPILGSLLAGALSSDGGATQLTSGMVGFGAALALPFGLFASAPKLMDKLPRSGSWMTSFKVILGFIELALAFKFLSNADLVKQWGLLKYETFMIIWILCALGIAAYLLNLIRFPHDSPNRKLSPAKIGGAIFSLALAIYMGFGLTYDKQFNSYRSLELLSGLAPPTGYSYLHPSHCPNNLNCFHDLTEGMNYAKEKNKPVLLDFTGYACVNCRKMEEHVWPVKSVHNKIKNDYVLISLYVDDKTPLDEVIEVQRPNGEGIRKLRKQGDIWQHFQTTHFQNNSQPFYVLLSPEGRVLSAPVGYTPDVNTYAEFLDCGLQTLVN